MAVDGMAPLTLLRKEEIQDANIWRQNDVHRLLEHEGHHSAGFLGTVNYIETSTKLKAWINWVRSEKRETFHLQHDNARPYASFYDKVPVG